LALAGAALARRLDPASDAPACVAFSGGSDSLALLLMARAWAAEAGRRLLVLTVDHGLNPESRAWTERAGRLAAELGLDFRALPWLGAKPRTGLPAAARRARHVLLAEAARDAGARVVLLGHTADDLIEAGLMRDAGSSVGSPAEWAPSPTWPEGRGVFLLRPLLAAHRAELRRILAEHGFDWLEDPANEDPRFARARARAAAPDLPPSGGAPAKPGRGAEGRQVVFYEPPSRPSAGLPPEGADLTGVIRGPRAAFADPRTLAMALVCAGGGERLPRGVRLERLIARLRSGEAFTATLCGARIAVAEEVLITRDAGRAGLPVMDLAPGDEAVWDGRFLVRAERSCRIGPLKGRASALPRAERDALRTVPAAARTALPAFQDGEAVTCPILAHGSWASARSLVGERFTGACGRIAREHDLAGGSDGEWASGALS
jgi:tRNA(Ile)-lysidine synthase